MFQLLELNTRGTSKLRYICTQFEHILSNFQQKWLHLDSLTEYTVAVHNKCHALDNCWGFIDGTVRPICRPGENQRVAYHGHKRVHALKYQSIINSSLCEVIAFSDILTMLRLFEVKNIWLQKTRSTQYEIWLQTRTGRVCLVRLSKMIPA